MQKIQNDEEIIDKLYSYLNVNFSRLKFKMKEPLKNIFPEPENRWLKSFWKNNSHADISVYRHGKLVCIIEPGGWYHIQDEKQKVRDLKKDKICKINGVNCLRFFNDVVNNKLDNSKTKRLFKKYFYGRNFK